MTQKHVDQFSQFGQQITKRKEAIVVKEMFIVLIENNVMHFSVDK